jgi:diguanylate cyclase (GGDEF)-like protein
VALVTAAVLLFRQPLRDVLDAIQAVEAHYRLDFLPALLLLIVAFGFHQYRKHVQVRADAAAATADAAQARREARTLQQLVAFSHGLGHALDRGSLQQVLWKHLPTVAGDRQFSVLLREGDAWDIVVQQDASGSRPAHDLEPLAERAVREMSARPGDAENLPPVNTGADVWFPIVVGTHMAGVLGVSAAPPLTHDAQSAMSAAAAMIAIAFKNMQLLFETREMSIRDSLTGCFNRGHGVETLGLELARARRTGGPVSVLMFDIDNFKGVNDHHGHLWGDELLRAVGTQLGCVLRRTDVRCRYGGDEFLVILPETPSLGAQQVAEALRQNIASLSIHADQSTLGATISIGVAASVPGEINAKAILARADHALYQAKRAGRNRVALAVPPSAADAESSASPDLRHVMPQALAARAG